MTTTRLNSDIRAAITKAATEHAFKKRETAHEKRAKAWSLAVYREALGPNGLRLIKKMPESWLVQEDGFYCRFAGQTERISLGAITKLPYGWTRSGYSNSGSSHPSLPASHPLSEERLLLAAERSKLDSDRQMVRANIQAVLMSHSTLEGLFKTWPECKRFAPPAAPQSVALALPIKQLNEMIGL